MPLVDFHSHTNGSIDSLTTPEKFIATARKKGLGRVVVTDHNSIQMGQATRELAPELIIVGEEIKTTKGEILAAFVREAVPRDLEPDECIRRLREQGAFISVSHPFDTRSGAWALQDLLQIAPLVDAIEVFNARIWKPDANKLAQEFARGHNLPGTAGSDAHGAFELGAGCVDLPPFNSAEELRQLIRQGKVQGKVSPWWVHAVSSYARWRKMVV